MQNKSGQKDIHSKAIDWEASLAIAYKQSESRAWKIAGVSVSIAILSMAGLVFMLPFYKIIPVTFLVDKATGEAQLIDASGPIPISDAQKDKHWIEEYVNSRERYNWMLLQYDHDHTLSLSDENVAKEYSALFEGDKGMDKELGSFTERRIKIISTTLPPGVPGTAVVRFERSTRERGYDTEIAGKYIATISYKYIKPKVLMLEKDIVANPYGFKITGYVVDKEEKSAVPAADVSAQSAYIEGNNSAQSQSETDFNSAQTTVNTRANTQ